jgi:ABC-type multidrug transport system fused ATPase/permease subunit
MGRAEQRDEHILSRRRRTSISDANPQQNTFKRLFKYMGPDWPILSGAFLALIVSSACNSALPWVIGKALDESSTIEAAESTKEETSEPTDGKRGFFWTFTVSIMKCFGDF